MKFGPIDGATWLEVARSCDYATFFHTPMWAELATRTFPSYKAAPRSALLASGVRVVLPLVEVGRRGLNRLAVTDSSAFGCYGGLIADGDLNEHEAIQVIRVLRSGLGELRVTQSPYSPLPAPRLAVCTARDDFTDVIELGDGFEAVTRRFARGRRQDIAKGRSAGVRTRVATSRTDFDAYFDVYEESIRRWGERTTMRYPRVLTEILFDLGERYPDEVRLWLAEQDGVLLSGCVIFYWKHHVAGWHLASCDDAFKLFGPSVLVADVIEDACRRGFGYFDFNPSGGLEGAAQFKRYFGAERRPVLRVHSQHRLLRLSDVARRPLFR